MLPEALVLLACTTSKGCTETSAHYYNTHPDFRRIVETNEKKVEEFVGPKVIATVGPFLYVAAGGTGTVRLPNHFSLQIGKERCTLAFRLEW
jgi:hypothetical protein